MTGFKEAAQALGMRTPAVPTRVEQERLKLARSLVHISAEDDGFREHMWKQYPEWCLQQGEKEKGTGLQ